MKKLLLLSLFLIPTLGFGALDKENIPGVGFEYLVDGQEPEYSLQQEQRLKCDQQVFQLDPHQKSVYPLYYGWYLQQLMKNSAIELANDFAFYVANCDLATVQEKLAKNPWLVNRKDDRGYLPVFTAIENEQHAIALVLFKKMKNKKAKCNGRPIKDYIEEEIAFFSGEEFQIQRDQEEGLPVEEKRKNLYEKKIVYKKMQDILNSPQRTVARQTEPATTLHTKDKKSIRKCGKREGRRLHKK